MVLAVELRLSQEPAQPLGIAELAAGPEPVRERGTATNGRVILGGCRIVIIGVVPGKRVILRRTNLRERRVILVGRIVVAKRRIVRNIGQHAEVILPALAMRRQKAGFVGHPGSGAADRPGGSARDTHN